MARPIGRPDTSTWAGADAWHSAWINLGIDVGAIEDRPWGMREFSLVDPGGNLIRVGHNL